MLTERPTTGWQRARHVLATRIIRPMHLLIPFAAPGSEAGRSALRTLALPNLQFLLARLLAAPADDGEDISLTPPHERALASLLGFTGGDGRLPWAAWRAAADGIAVGSQPWGELTPAHWHVGTDQVSLLDPAQLMLDETGSRALFDAVAELFTSAGFDLRWGAPQRWYLSHASLAGLPCASLDRVIGRNVDRWLTADPASRLLRRLQNEVQMQLYNHPINERRETLGQLTVNSFWLSGCGVAQPVTGKAPQVDDRLRGPALGDDWAAWVRAWDTLDAGPLAALAAACRNGADVRLTLCGERASVTWASTQRSAWQRLAGIWRSPAVAPLLEPL